jgi:hypothetical protein
MRYSAHHAIVLGFILGFGMLLLANASARADEVLDSSREQIIQSTRDDVRRKIQEQNEIPAENRAEAATAGKQPTTGSAHGSAKQERLDKQDTPK